MGGGRFIFKGRVHRKFSLGGAVNLPYQRSPQETTQSSMETSDLLSFFFFYWSETYLTQRLPSYCCRRLARGHWSIHSVMQPSPSSVSRTPHHPRWKLCPHEMQTLPAPSSDLFLKKPKAILKPQQAYHFPPASAWMARPPSYTCECSTPPTPSRKISTSPSRHVHQSHGLQPVGTRAQS